MTHFLRKVICLFFHCFLGCDGLREHSYANGETVREGLKKPLIWDARSCIDECFKQKRKYDNVGAVFIGAQNDKDSYRISKRKYFCHCANGGVKTEKIDENGIKGCIIKGIAYILMFYCRHDFQNF